MKPIVTIMAPGGMGAALGTRLVQHGVEVRAALAGRSASTVARAFAAGFTAVEEAELIDVDIFLSVVPPNEAFSLAKRIAESLRPAKRRPVYVDCNAVNPETAAKIAAVIEGAGGPFVDGSLIGLPPREGTAGPTLFVSGPQAKAVAVLNDYGLAVSVLDGPVGAASALKMSYAGVTKGLIALGSAMILAADRAGAGEALRDELAKSQAQLFAGFGRSIPDMFGKARRWVPEMNEIAGFVTGDPAAEQIFAGFAALYERLAADNDGKRGEIDTLQRFFQTPGKTDSP
jgi:3-hydroxyisobutyrate dehydrogenase-like beta-hydroxyacid dehydrogenase